SFCNGSLLSIIIHDLADSNLYSLSLHDALPILTGGLVLVHGSAGDLVGERMRRGVVAVAGDVGDYAGTGMLAGTLLVFGRLGRRDRKSTRLNSSHVKNSYAVFCLKKKKIII